MCWPQHTVIRLCRGPLDDMFYVFYTCFTEFWLDHMTEHICPHVLVHLLKCFSTATDKNWHPVTQEEYFCGMFCDVCIGICISRDTQKISSSLTSTRCLSCVVYCSLSLWVKWDGIWGCQNLTKSLLTRLEGGLTRLERTELPLCLSSGPTHTFASSYFAES